MTLSGPIYAGTAVTTTVTFTTPPEGILTDPTAVTLKFRWGNNAATVWTYGGTGSIVRVSEGVYSAELDTSGTVGVANWMVEWIGTGACAAVEVATFPVQPPPL